MPQCPSDTDQAVTIGSKIFAQTLFLGSSVLSYSVNMGWGGQPSTLSVELMNDYQPLSCYQNGQPIPLFKFRTYQDNHYHTCVGDDCYVDENGDPYNSNRNPPPLQKKIPGKVFYTWTPNKGLVSKYWFLEDPGFFGDATSIDVNGQYTPGQYTSYDIIGTPVYFVMDSFVFGGIVQSWEKNNRQGQITYTVTIESLDNLLDNSWLILRDYGGSIFTRLDSSSPYGAPLSYVGPGVINNGTIAQGNIPNVFNVYGFLESFATNGFGGAGINDNGIAYTDVLNALSVLTSCTPLGSNDAGQLEYLNKRAFSPFGRIITKTIQENGSFIRPINGLGFGTIPAVPDINGVERNTFVLDLSELPSPSKAMRLQSDVMSIMEFIRGLTSQTGSDFFTTLIPAVLNNNPYNIIKIKVIDRNFQPAQNQISATVNSLQAMGYAASVDTIGKEFNQSGSPKVLYIGGKQERLYQAKNYRLSYKQSAFIYNPATTKFVSYTIPSGGKIRVPTPYSTRNPFLSIEVNGADTTAIFDQTEQIHNALEKITFNSGDSSWVDFEAGGRDGIYTGNYNKSKIIKNNAGNGRYIPIYMDVICPFFGYALEDKVSISTGQDSNNFRKIRPVWLDSWTGQLVVVCSIFELPLLTMGTSSVYRTEQLKAFTDQGTFFITETEMRAAMDGFDSYFTYCTAKSSLTKPHLFQMLVTAYYYANPKLAALGGWNQLSPTQGVPWLPPANIFAKQDEDGRIEFDYIFDNNFIKDLMALCSFVASIGQQNYGRRYMVRIPDIKAYKDQEYADIDLPASDYGGSISVFTGSSKLFFNVEPSNSGWEEWGNMIDDAFMVGSEAWYSIIDDEGKIPPLLGYNASDNYDYEALRLCLFSKVSLRQKSNLVAALNTLTSQDKDRPGLPRAFGLTSDNKATLTSWLESLQQSENEPVVAFDTGSANFNRMFLAGQGPCETNRFLIPSLDLSVLNKDQFVIVNNRSSRTDAYGDPLPLPASKKLFLKSNIENLAFMDHKSLRDPRVIITSDGIRLNPTSVTFSIDPTRTVMCNAALEDLIVYLRLTGSNPAFYNEAYVSTLLKQIRGYDFFPEATIKNGQLDFTNNGAGLQGSFVPNFGYNLNVSSEQAMLAPKAAHPHFAAIPLKSNKYTYGPWTNYPSLIGDDLFLPGITQEILSYRIALSFYATQLQKLNSQNDSDKHLIDAIIKNIDMLADKIARITSMLDKFDSNYAIENFIGNTKVEINTDLVPWVYGGMAFLDQAVIALMQSNTDYQSILETAQITVANTPMFGIGGEFKVRNNEVSDGYILFNNDLYEVLITDLAYSDVKLVETGLGDLPIVGNPINPPPSFREDIFNLNYSVVTLKAVNRTGTAPVISNISVRFDGGITTTYAFRTYARRLGLYSKEQADRLKRAAKNNINFNKALFSTKNNIISALSIEGQSRLLSGNSDNRQWTGQDLNTKLFGTSPTEVLIGGAKGYFPSKGLTEAQLAMAFASYDIQSNTFKTPDNIDVLMHGKDPGDNPVNSNSGGNKYRHRAWVGMFQHWETKKELEEGYNQKSAMSLDGIFSPISFYPTIGRSTYHLMSYDPRYCMHCRGTKILIQYEKVNGKRKQVSYACPSCSQTLPPYLMDPAAVSGVNALNLQPVVVPYPVWRNAHAQPAASGERQRHSIRLVARNEIPPFGAMNSISLDIDKNKEIFIDPETGKKDTRGNGVSPDFFMADIVKTRATKTYFANNQRFFSLRGPLMLHGWGYDTSGNPVPNAADEPRQIDASGRPKRFKLTSSGTNDLRSDGYFLPPDESTFLGDVIGKGWKKEDGEWKRTPSEYFYLNWAERPDLWPVGPIDLRWDHKRGVWTAAGDGVGSGGCTGNDLPPFIVASGINDMDLLSKFTLENKSECSFKPVYVTLETDLIKEDNYDETKPTRGFLDDIQYSTNPLPQNTRRLVFVKDKCGYTAPRGAKLLCRYDNDSGFYEPLSKPTFFVFGTISSGDTAIIDLSYVQGKHRGENTPTMLINFDKRLNIETPSNAKGMFYFENGKWILISANIIK